MWGRSMGRVVQSSLPTSNRSQSSPGSGLNRRVWGVQSTRTIRSFVVLGHSCSLAEVSGSSDWVFFISFLYKLGFVFCN
ncbi:hypothetical protein Mapa_005639 [Marchantia paleacea]|nr:hypothetical protein Mapa_005639 [Marchantia paleacea]